MKAITKPKRIKSVLIEMVRMLQGKGDLQYRCSCGASWSSINYSNAAPHSMLVFSCDICLEELKVHVKKGVKL